MAAAPILFFTLLVSLLLLPSPTAARILRGGHNIISYVLPSYAAGREVSDEI